MKFEKKNIVDFFLIKVESFYDERGAFRRHFCKRELKKNGIIFNIMQGNISENYKKGTLRGFHYNSEISKENKILSCLNGRAWNVTIDLRPNSKTFFEKFEFEISSYNKISAHIPAGCANAFLTLEDNCLFHYYMGSYYNDKNNLGIRYDDPNFNIQWPIIPKIMSKSDKNLPFYSKQK